MKLKLYPLSVICSSMLLGAVGVNHLVLQAPPADAAVYHAHVDAVAKTRIPADFDGWLGREGQVPQAAVAILHPNVIRARHYERLGTFEGATFLLVQCKDARDILGHFPPICYVAQGWVLGSATQRIVSLDGRELNCTRYVFDSDGFSKASELTLDDFMLLPSGQTCPDMAGVNQAARNHRQSFFGAAQVQVVYDTDTPAAARDSVFDSIVHANRPVIDAILSPGPAIIR